MGYNKSKTANKDLNIAEEKWDSLGVTKEKFIISYIGAITKNKLDLELVFSAAKKLEKSNPEIIFVICGEGDQKTYFQTISSKNIHFPGWVNNSESQSLLSRSNLGLVPLKNRFDFLMSIPNKPIEYFFYGLPVITSLNGQLANLLNYYKTGIVYSPLEGHLLKIIITLKENPELVAEMSSNAKKLFAQKFSAYKVYSDYSKYIEKYGQINK